MNEDLSKMNPLLLQLILSLQAGAMQQMGKIASPLDGKVEQDLKAAQFSIDVLGMLEEKMKGNLTEEEAKLISHVLYELRLNFVDEAKKHKAEEEAEKKSEGGPAEASPEKEEGDKTEPETPPSE
jgi:hypothetical protein